MKRGATVFLRAVLVLVGIGALTFLLWEPHLEGRNANATVFAIYFRDPFLAYVYAGSIPFFVGLYHGVKVLASAGRNEEFSPSVVKSLRTIRYCAIALIGFTAIGEVLLFMGDNDDRPAAVFMGLVVILPSIIVATAMTVLERALQNAVDIKSEHDLTV